MKLCRIIITNYKQFDKFDLNLTDLESKKPLEKICFIGNNGTGKTTILEVIRDLFQGEQIILKRFATKFTDNYSPGFAFILENTDGELFLFGKPTENKESKKLLFSNIFVTRGSITPSLFLPLNLAKSVLGDSFIEDVFIDLSESKKSTLYDLSAEYLKNEKLSLNILLQNNGKRNLLVFSPVESNSNANIKVSWPNLAKRNDASVYYNNFPHYNEISYSFLKSFWALITYQVLQIDKLRNEYESLPENIEKRKIDLIREFNAKNPDFLKLLANKWNKILDSCGLFFDYEKAKIPQTLEDNLEAFIKTKKDERVIQYFELSTGIRNFIFRIGYLYALYFNRNVDSAIVLFDEPEFSLHPELLRSIISYYADKNEFPNSQFFFATHNATVASQFAPEERVILNLDDDYHVLPQMGSAPEGDDPNDILLQDFGISNTMTSKGIEKWKEYLDLKKQARITTVEEEKEELLTKAMEIALEYKFGNNETNNQD